jgi:uncharacterized protein (DUF2235 family)
MVVAKNIVLLSDGTGNSSVKILKTNVWRLFQALDLKNPKEQVAYYDDGVGTSSNKYIAAITGIFGYGLKRNVLDIYCFCCRNYEPGDRIYGFGFSRGSFTMRVVAGLIASTGLVWPYSQDEATLRRDATIAYRHYRRRATAGGLSRWFIARARDVRDWISHHVWRKPSFQQIPIKPVDKIHFLGLWDTVDAYGGPIDEIVRAIDYWYWPLSMPDRFMNWKIQRACHALSLEDERDAFKPVLWDERYVKGVAGAADAKHNLHPMSKLPGTDEWAPPKSNGGALPAIDQERLSQVWFVGVHCDIGGGYSQDGLGYFTLDWMIDRAKVYDLKLLDVQTDWLKSLVNPLDKLNDSRSGFAAYYRYKPRKLADIYSLPPYRLSVSEDWRNIKRMWRNLEDPEDEVREALAPGVTLLPRPKPKIHDAVFERVAVHPDGYVPIVIPQAYQVTDAHGAIRPNLRETDDQAKVRALRQEKVWDWVWARRVTYFLTMLALLLIALLPMFERLSPARPGGAFESLSPLIAMVASRMPDFLKPWFDAFEHGPGRLVLGVLFAGGLSVAGTLMQGHIRDLMRPLWLHAPGPEPVPNGFIYRMRSSGKYRASFYVLNHWLLPSLFAIAIGGMLTYAATVLGSRLLFPTWVILGQVCEPSAPTAIKAVTGAAPVTAGTAFKTSEVCHATGLQAHAGQTYTINLKINDAWADKPVPGWFGKSMEWIGQTPGGQWVRNNAPKFIGRWFEPRPVVRIETTPEGFGWDKTPWRLAYRLPFRRYASVDWFRPIVRVGSSGFDEQPLAFKPVAGAADQFTADFKARANGEVFLFVNDVVSGYWSSTWYYGDNEGSATVSIMPKN